MFKRILILLYFFYVIPIYAQDYGSGDSSNSFDILASGGYSMMTINGDPYTGYNAFFKLFFPLGSGLYFGIGSRYESMTSTASSSSAIKNASNHQNSFTYQSIQAGLDLAYKISFSDVDFQINPYAYYAFSNTWMRNTTMNNSTISSTGPVTFNLVYGVGGSLLFKFEPFYIGPSAYYSWGYISSDAYSDNFGNAYFANAGFYTFTNYNLTLGFYL
ncbi:hypothetical protein [Silvanigrella aquatica]|nr:hypothetical protein [Silvanigrella aquatica]